MFINRFSRLARFNALAICMFASTVEAQALSPSAEVFVQSGHAILSTAVAYSPDGRKLASCDGVGIVIGWDAGSGLQYRTLTRHTGLCMGIAFSPDGLSVYSSGGARSGQEIFMTRYVDGVVQKSWEGHKGFVVGLVASHKQDGVWSLGEQDGLKQWTVQSAAPLKVIQLPTAPYGAATALVIDKSESTAWVGTRSGKVLRIDLASGEVNELLDLKNPVSSIDLSPDGHTLAVANGELMGSTQRDVLLIEVKSGAVRQRLTGHTGNVFSLAFSPDGTELASAAQIDLQTLVSGSLKDTRQQEAVRIWKLDGIGEGADGGVGIGAVTTEPQVFFNTRNQQGVPFLKSRLAYAPDSKSLAMSMWDEAVRTYTKSANAWVPSNVLEGRGVAARQIASSPVQDQLAVSDGRPRVAKPTSYWTADQVFSDLGDQAQWTDEARERIKVLYGERGFSRFSQTASVWDLSTGRLSHSHDWQLGPTAFLGVDPSGEFSSLAPLFPNTITVAPLKGRLIRQAWLNKEGNPRYRHFSYEGSQGEPDNPLITFEDKTPARTAGAMAMSNTLNRMAVVVDPVQKTGEGMKSQLTIMARGADSLWDLLHEVPLPGTVLKMAYDPLGNTLWLSGTLNGQPYSDEHQAYVMAVDAQKGRDLKMWRPEKGITIDDLVVDPKGQWAASNGLPQIMLWRLGSAQAVLVHVIPKLDRNIKALALSPDGKQLAVSSISGLAAVADWGRDWGRVKSQVKGKSIQSRLIWKQNLPTPAPHLLIWMQKGQRIAAAADDGSVRLLQANSGQEVARFIRFDNDEWISILPQGYFVASKDGDKWVNVRINGAVYGISQFYDVFYRPDIVQRHLANEPVQDLITVTLDDAVKRPPPMVQLKRETMLDQAGAINRFNIMAKNQGGGIGEIRILHNGKWIDMANKAIFKLGVAKPGGDTSTAGMNGMGIPATGQASTFATAQATTRALKIASQAQVARIQETQSIERFEHNTDVELSAGDNEITVMALNAAGDLSSRPITLKVAAQGTQQPPKVWLLTMGINQFKASQFAPALQYAVKDAQDFSTTFVQHIAKATGAASVVHIQLTNEQAGLANLQMALDRIQAEAKPQDVFVWFVASHGTLDAQAQYGLVLHDWDGKTEASSLFSTERILDATRRIKAFRQIVILDTCHAGGISGWLRGLYDARFAVMARNMGLHMFASASDTQEALDGYQNNGLFTHNLLKGLTTPLADGDSNKQVTVVEWGLFAQRETTRIAKLLRHKQEPMLMNFGKDITVYGTQTP